MGKMNRSGRGSSMGVVAAYQLSWFARGCGGSWDMGFSVAKMETVLSKLGWSVTLVSERARTFRVGRTWF